MTLTQFVVFLVVGGLAGWVAGVVVRGGGQGVLVNVVVGILGAFLGGWILGSIGLRFASGLGGLFLTATLGAVILLTVLRLIRSGR